MYCRDLLPPHEELTPLLCYGPGELVSLQLPALIVSLDVLVVSLTTRVAPAVLHSLLDVLATQYHCMRTAYVTGSLEAGYRVTG